MKKAKIKKYAANIRKYIEEEDDDIERRTAISYVIMQLLNSHDIIESIGILEFIKHITISSQPESAPNIWS